MLTGGTAHDVRAKNSRKGFFKSVTQSVNETARRFLIDMGNNESEFNALVWWSWIGTEEMVVKLRDECNAMISILQREASISPVDWDNEKPSVNRLRDVRNRLAASEWNQLRLAVFERDNFSCVYCGAHGVPLHCDHVHPLALGGTNIIENLATACAACNLSKSDTPLEIWAASQPQPRFEIRPEQDETDS
jgi:5-methylcytosine-specific restriction endonuclease McrA